MIRRCVLKLLLVLLIKIEKRSQKNYRCRDNDAEIRMPGTEGRRNVKCPKFHLGHATPVRAIVSAGRGLPALPAPRGVVEAVVSTACLSARWDEHRSPDVLPLRRYAIGERVGVNIGVITQT